MFLGKCLWQKMHLQLAIFIFKQLQFMLILISKILFFHSLSQLVNLFITKSSFALIFYHFRYEFNFELKYTNLMQIMFNKINSILRHTQHLTEWQGDHLARRVAACMKSSTCTLLWPILLCSTTHL